MKFFIRFKDGVEFTTEGNFSFYPNMLDADWSIRDYYKV